MPGQLSGLPANPEVAMHLGSPIDGGGPLRPEACSSGAAEAPGAPCGALWRMRGQVQGWARRGGQTWCCWQCLPLRPVKSAGTYLDVVEQHEGGDGGKGGVVQGARQDHVLDVAVPVGLVDFRPAAPPQAVRQLDGVDPSGTATTQAAGWLDASWSRLHQATP